MQATFTDHDGLRAEVSDLLGLIDDEGLDEAVRTAKPSCRYENIRGPVFHQILMDVWEDLTGGAEWPFGPYQEVVEYDGE